MCPFFLKIIQFNGLVQVNGNNMEELTHITIFCYIKRNGVFELCKFMLREDSAVRMCTQQVETSLSNYYSRRNFEVLKATVVYNSSFDIQFYCFN